MSEQIAVLKLDRSVVESIIKDLNDGELEVVILIALTENLVNITTDLLGKDIGAVLENMIRQLGEGAVAGAAEHFGVTQERFDPLIGHAERLLAATAAVANKATEAQHDPA